METLILILLTILFGVPLVFYTYWLFVFHPRLDKSVVEFLRSDKQPKTNILFIYPHPDDEIMFSGGLIAHLSKNLDFETYCISTTSGEGGTELLKVSKSELAQIRIEEYRQVMNVLGVRNSYVWDFPDGELTHNKLNLKRKIRHFIKQNKIEAVVTYEKYGAYPHPDHIALASVVNEISKENYYLKILYATIPEKIAKVAHFPDELTYANGKVVKLENIVPTRPELRFPVWKYLSKKQKAVKLYKSQNLSQGVPIELKNVLMPYEYYTKVYPID